MCNQTTKQDVKHIICKTIITLPDSRVKRYSHFPSVFSQLFVEGAFRFPSKNHSFGCQILLYRFTYAAAQEKTGILYRPCSFRSSQICPL